MQRAAAFTILLLLILCTGLSVSAQKKQTDTSHVKILNPRKATIYSAVCPGLGQIYNGRVWKAAILYAGFAGVTYGLIFNQNQYQSYQHAVNVRFDTLASTVDDKYPTLTDGTVQSLRNYHRRNRDICILALFGVYALNIIDANVDAQLQEFKINKDLSLSWKPEIGLANSGFPGKGIKLTLTF